MLDALAHVIKLTWYAFAESVLMPPKWIPDDAIVGMHVEDNVLIVEWHHSLDQGPARIPCERLKLPEAEWLMEHGSMLGFRKEDCDCHDALGNPRSYGRQLWKTIQNAVSSRLGR